MCGSSGHQWWRRWRRYKVTERCAQVRCTISYYDYGVLSVEFELPFECGMGGSWCEGSGEWMTDPELEKKSAEVVRCASQARISAAMVHPYDYQLDEDYHLIQIQPVTEGDAALSAAELIARQWTSDRTDCPRRNDSAVGRRNGGDPGVRGSRTFRMICWWLAASAALVYDTAEGAGPTNQLLAYAGEFAVAGVPALRSCADGTARRCL